LTAIDWAIDDPEAMIFYWRISMSCPASGLGDQCRRLDSLLGRTDGNHGFRKLAIRR